MTTTHTTTTGRRRLRQVVADHPVTSFAIIAFAIGWPLLVIRTTTAETLSGAPAARSWRAHH